jgi:hypothetical protein
MENNRTNYIDFSNWKNLKVKEIDRPIFILNGNAHYLTLRKLNFSRNIYLDKNFNELPIHN